METVALALGTMVLYLVAYHTYGRFLARRIFGLSKENKAPAHELEDGQDYVPTKPEILFGHHYTSIAGTGPIVGPAIAIIWGWVPALIWILLGSIFMGAVHDFGALVVSLRHKGKSIGDISAQLISPRVRFIFLSIIFFCLLIVIAIFCMVIAALFAMFPATVIPIWAEIPIALAVGYLIYRKGMKALPVSIIGVLLLYVAIVIGAKYPVAMPALGPFSALTTWTIILLIYAAIASILPVWRLLQPRDYINGHELYIALVLLALGVLFAHPVIVAPAVDMHPAGAPPLWPLLFVTIACGAISGFHSLVASGTTSKQLSEEPQAQTIGYGAMLMEGLLAVFVVIAVAAGIGLATKGSELSGVAAWTAHYSSWAEASSLGKKVGAFVNGSANMLTRIGIPMSVALAIMGVFVASFAGTTLDTATRIQRYVVSELAASMKLKALSNKYTATAFAVVTAGFLALVKGGGAGGLILWPLFGATNQLLACLALLVVTVYLAKKGKPIVYTFIPMLFMMVMTGWAMIYNLVMFYREGLGSLHLLVIGIIVVALEAWMIVEAFGVLLSTRRARSPQQSV
jgi:carbon starvation protein